MEMQALRSGPASVRNALLESRRKSPHRLTTGIKQNHLL